MRILPLVVIMQTLFIITSGYISNKAIYQTIDSYNDLIKNYKAIELTEELLSTCKDAETGQRGYIITSNEDYLYSYNLGKNKIDSRIQSILDAGFVEKDQMQHLIFNINEKMAELEKTILLKKNGDEKQALAIIKSNFGREKMLEIRKITEEIIDKQNDILVSKKIAVEDAAFFNKSILYFILFIMIFSKIIIIITLFSYYKQQNTLLQKTNDLARSNHDLEQFAYIASHDLQEPLRMVASYCKLLEKRYSNLLDVNGKEFLFYAVDGSKRMQSLINDLLTYSRIRSKTKPFEIVNLNNCLSKTLENIRDTINEKNAIITSDVLPSIMGDKTQLCQLLQNLIINGIKFCPKDRTPSINISYIRKYNFWEFCLKDNGIGIDEKYKDSLFVIFKRLNNKTEYPGTGIGLALCKSIVEKHGGKIRFESTVNEGTSFYFNLKRIT